MPGKEVVDRLLGSGLDLPVEEVVIPHGWLCEVVLVGGEAMADVRPGSHSGSILEADRPGSADPATADHRRPGTGLVGDLLGQAPWAVPKSRNVMMASRSSAW